ncbi:hypothetical protein NHX12_029265 [Muraenolepis orangiensis]|uniref:Uncharacterized protein n=1 Tax=Muraenolepis orangiensis TaxID=630683 RepID=A0A9Q0IND1_9TELE|nr:hypothetical protein NHX12_029265 [Muraenolepis orangiensis]
MHGPLHSLRRLVGTSSSSTPLAPPDVPDWLRDLPREGWAMGSARPRGSPRGPGSDPSRGSPSSWTNCSPDRPATHATSGRSTTERGVYSTLWTATSPPSPAGCDTSAAHGTVENRI